MNVLMELMHKSIMSLGWFQGRIEIKIHSYIKKKLTHENKLVDIVSN